MKGAEHYFAYGANLSMRDMARWCAEQGYPPRLLRAVEPAWIPNAALVFRSRSPVRRGGTLDIRPCPGSLVPGMLFEVTDERGWQALDLKEGVGTGRYERVRLTVRTLAGGEAPAVTYAVRPEQHVGPVEPAPGYVEVVREGLREFGLPELPLEAAARHDAPPRARDIIETWRASA